LFSTTGLDPGNDYDADLAKYGEELGIEHGAPLEQDELDILHQHNRNDGGIGWNWLNLDIPTAMRMAEKIVPIIEKLEQESSKDANQVKEKLRVEHGLDIDKLVELKSWLS